MTFFISTPNQGVTDAYQGSLFSQERVKSYSNLLTGDRLAADIAKQPGVGLSADQVQARIAAETIPETVLLRATVTDGSKERSKRIADALATEFGTMIESLETPPGAETSAVKVAVVAGPQLNEVPVSPRPLRNLGLAILLGLLLGLGASVLRELLDNTIKSSDALRDLAGAPVLATIPNDSAAAKTPLINGDATRSARAEALRQLRTNLQFVNVDRPVRLLVVTSAVPSEGKSSTAVNLGIVFAEAGQRVLLIDADLRRPKVAEYLGMEGAVGLTNLLAGQAKPDDVIQPWGPGMWVLPSGFIPPNPSELLASRHMTDLLRTFRERFDMVIIDSPPLLPVTDAAVLATSADGAVMVARAAKTSSAQITGALAALRAVNARLLGCVLNMVPARRSDEYYYYGGYESVAADASQHPSKSGEGGYSIHAGGSKTRVSATRSAALSRVAAKRGGPPAREPARAKRGR